MPVASPMVGAPLSGIGIGQLQEVNLLIVAEFEPGAWKPQFRSSITERNSQDTCIEIQGMPGILYQQTDVMYAGYCWFHST